MLTGFALCAFAANSLLCRGALGARHIDAASFTTIRLVAGALTLGLLRAARAVPVPAATGTANPWSALALFAYAIAFSFAYLRIGAGIGALVLFGSVQATMLGTGIVRDGERPRTREWIGLTCAAGGLIALTAPGSTAPDPVGCALMALAGVAWGVYSLRGRGTVNPLDTTAGNFALAVPLALLCSVVTIGREHVTSQGALYAAASGSIASGVGYAVWYAALRGLTATRAAIVQLLVPVLAAVGGALLLAEAPSLRLCAAGAAIVGGVALAILRRPVAAA